MNKEMLKIDEDEDSMMQHVDNIPLLKSDNSWQTSTVMPPQPQKDADDK